MSGFDMFQNSGYKNMRNRKKTLIIDINDSDTSHLGDGTEFTINLREPLIIDKHSEVYLDNFLTFNCNLGDTINHSAFALKINEFNMNGSIASSSTVTENIISNSIIIPNDNNNVDNYFATVVHKGKKFNYICDINPITISSISGKITDLIGNPIFHGTGTGTKFTYAIVGIEKWALVSGTPRALIKDEGVTSISVASGTDADNAVSILTNTVQGASTIYFTSSDILTPSEWTGHNIDFVVPDNGYGGAYSFQIATADNRSIILLNANGRFISEFSIVSRE